MSQSPWWSPSRHADRRPALLARNRAQAAIRGFLAAQDFVEVDPNALVPSPGNETHLHAFSTAMIGNDGAARTMYLHTSPEFAMKKLLAAGEPRIAAFTHVWRNRERGQRHSPEFTMLEWYRTGEDYAVLMQDVAEMARLACKAAGSPLLRHRGLSCDPFVPFQRISVAQAFRDHAGIDLLATLLPDGRTDRDALAAGAQAAGVLLAGDDTWSDIFSRLLSEKVEPHLGHDRLTVLDRYPVAEAALARTCADDPREAERFEVYACGVELANGFGELTDPKEQRRRFEAEMNEKERIYGERYPLDEEFLAALSLMPEAAGIAMGFDRLAMLATAAPSVDDVIWTPISG
ncbi:EF-P lysine aminoacylase GenX [Pseudooceanicola sp. CBS1P-1]|uniref:EF-P lysine aminoacylase GenX n=1 Tax=Pseudooceanicola albus TaxID=2692189 RepID=A0A6L7G4W6_9RHOB|nr:MULTISPECIES: EF-P lysine aminoacylase EpmA [Pseudooceanicola]MBT9383819.1 EF-P lysine aminoacylase GenX [Pseudooceanicola endophyticus]MXN17673.1 EF-P lysine aminoacylase GenX [Pseudooceanicola albus]